MWSQKEILKCKSIGDKAGAYVWLTNRTARKYHRIQRYAGIFMILFSFLTGASGIPSLVATEDLTIIRIVNGIVQGCLFFMGLVNTILEYINISDIRDKHLWASAAYGSMFIDIQKTLQTPADKRPDFAIYFASLQEKDFELSRKIPDIPKDIVKSYYQIMGTHAIKQDILFNDSDNLEICIDNEEMLTTGGAIPPTADIEIALKQSKSRRLKNTPREPREGFRITSTPRTPKTPSTPKTPKDNKRKKEGDEKINFQLERYFISQDDWI